MFKNSIHQRKNLNHNQSARKKRKFHPQLRVKVASRGRIAPNGGIILRKSVKQLLLVSIAKLKLVVKLKMALVLYQIILRGVKSFLPI
ncbi:putative homeodomain transcription factor 1 [Bienertia sinuspersici]